MRSDVPPAMKAPSGVKARDATAEPIVIECLDLVSDERAFHMLMAPSSPADANSLSESGRRAAGTSMGCQRRAVIWPWCALSDRITVL